MGSVLWVALLSVLWKGFEIWGRFCLKGLRDLELGRVNIEGRGLEASKSSAYYSCF